MLFIFLNRTRSRIQLAVCLIIVMLPSVACFAQASGADTIILSKSDAERIFLEKNLALIAQQYNIDINKALVQQARYWDNPVLNTDQNIYDGAFFRHNSDYGQVFIQIQQLIKTAGKRNKLIQLANDQVLTAQQQFNDLIRTLKYMLRTDLASVYQLTEANKIYNTELSSVQQLVKGMDAQLQAGNISQKDNIRLKALYFSMQSEQSDLLRQLADVQSELHGLLRDTSASFIAVNFPAPVNTDSVAMLKLMQLLDSARINRPDAKLAAANLGIQEHNLAYQKALGVPDLTVGVEYDQRSTYVNNYYGLAISLPLPILNQNKGNISAAQIAVKQAQTGILQVQNQVEQEVTAAYNKLMTTYRLKTGTSPDLQGGYDHLLQSMVQSYRRRQVDLLEFVDFFEAYKDARLKQLQLDNNLRGSMEEINLTTGKDIIHVN